MQTRWKRGKYLIDKSLGRIGIEGRRTSKLTLSGEVNGNVLHFLSCPCERWNEIEEKNLRQEFYRIRVSESISTFAFHSFLTNCLEADMFFEEQI